MAGQSALLDWWEVGGVIVSTVDSLGHCGGRGRDTATVCWCGDSTQGVIKLAGITVVGVRLGLHCGLTNNTVVALSWPGL